jgi:hypothetical protein
MGPDNLQNHPPQQNIPKLAYCAMRIIYSTCNHLEIIIWFGKKVAILPEFSRAPNLYTFSPLAGSLDLMVLACSAVQNPAQNIARVIGFFLADFGRKHGYQTLHLSLGQSGRSTAVLFVCDLFHPLNDFIVELFLNGDMGHGHRRGHVAAAQRFSTVA